MCDPNDVDNPIYMYINTITSDWIIPAYSAQSPVDNDGIYTKKGEAYFYCTNDINIIDAINAPDAQSNYASKIFSRTRTNFRIYISELENYYFSGINLLEGQSDKVTTFHTTVNNSADQSNEIVYIFDESVGGVIVPDTTSDVDFDMVLDDIQLSVTSSNCESVSFDGDNSTVTLSGNAADYELGFTYNDGATSLPWDHITVSGSNGETAEMSSNEDGYIYFSGNDLNGITISAKNDDTEENIMIYSDSDIIQISADENDDIKVMIDSNDDGIYDTDISDNNTELPTETTTEPSTEPSTEPPVTEPAGQEYLLGDVNGDGRVTSADARLILRCAVQLDSLSGTPRLLADLNRDNCITSADARLALRIAVRLDESQTITVETDTPPAPTTIPVTTLPATTLPAATTTAAPTTTELLSTTAPITTVVSEDETTTVPEEDTTQWSTEPLPPGPEEGTTAWVEEPLPSDDEDTPDIERLVQDARAQLFFDGEQAYYWRVPEIMLEGEEIEAVNEALWEAMYENALLPTLESSVNGFYVIGYGVIDYAWAVNGEVLSLWTICSSTEAEWREYSVYNISISEKAVLSTEEFLQEIGISSADYQADVEEALTAFHRESFGYDNMVVGSPDYLWAEEQLARTLSAENLASAVPFLNEDGALCLYCAVYSPGGAEFYYQLISVENHTALTPTNPDPDNLPSGDDSLDSTPYIVDDTCYIKATYYDYTGGAVAVSIVESAHVEESKTTVANSSNERIAHKYASRVFSEQDGSDIGIILEEEETLAGIELGYIFIINYNTSQYVSLPASIFGSLTGEESEEGLRLDAENSVLCAYLYPSLEDLSFYIQWVDGASYAVVTETAADGSYQRYYLRQVESGGYYLAEIIESYTAAGNMRSRLVIDTYDPEPVGYFPLDDLTAISAFNLNSMREFMDSLGIDEWSSFNNP